MDDRDDSKRTSEPVTLARVTGQRIEPGKANSETMVSLDLIRSMGADVREILIDLGTPTVPEVTTAWCFDVAPLYFPDQRSETAGRIALVYAPHDAHEVKRALIHYGAALFETVTGKA